MKAILLILILVLIPLASALYGGETWLYHFPECDELRVNITANLTIDDGEYTIHNYCEETYENYFICNCSDDFYFNVSFETNTVNNYNFKFNYDYSKEVVEKEVSGGDGGSRSSGGSGYAYDGMIKGNRTTTLNYGDVFVFSSKGYRHLALVLKVYNNSIKLRVTSKPLELELKTGETREVDTDVNELNDFRITLHNITKYGGLFTFTILEEIAIVEEKPITEKPDEELIGGDKDEHGCVATTGYTWCEAKQKCLREWEEPCEEEEEELIITEPIEPIKKSKVGWIIAILIIIIGIILIVVYQEKKNAKQKTKCKH